MERASRESIERERQEREIASGERELSKRGSPKSASERGGTTF